jgi:hypothetical protein
MDAGRAEIAYARLIGEGAGQHLGLLLEARRVELGQPGPQGLGHRPQRFGLCNRGLAALDEELGLEGVEAGLGIGRPKRDSLARRGWLMNDLQLHLWPQRATKASALADEGPSAFDLGSDGG